MGVPDCVFVYLATRSKGTNIQIWKKKNETQPTTYRRGEVPLVIGHNQ